MFLDQVSPRIQITIALSIGAHILLLQMFGSKPFQEATTKIKLTEVEFQEEISKPTEMEKLMTKIAAPPKPAPEVGQMDEIAAIEELQKESFGKVVGLGEKMKVDDFDESDLTTLAALPKLDMAVHAPAPAIEKMPTKRIALVRSSPSAMDELESNVVALDTLPPADFGPDITRRNFQQPELIIKKVKAERRAQKTKVDRKKQLSLRRGTFITGEVAKRERLHQVKPIVPRWVEEKGIQAEVVIRFVVDPDGEVGGKMFVEKTSGYAELDRLAMEALKKYVFAPLPLTVKQVEQSGTIVIRFTLKGK
jgi:TonB family protein